MTDGGAGRGPARCGACGSALGEAVVCPSCGAANTGTTPGYPTYDQPDQPTYPPPYAQQAQAQPQYQPQYQPPPAHGQPQYWSGPPLASTGARIGAYVLDWMFTVVVSVVVTLPFALVVGLSGDGSAEAAGEVSGRLSELVGIVVFFGYFAGSTALWGRTLGKRIVGLRVVNQADGRRPSAGQALGRYGIIFLTFLPCGIPAIINAATLGNHPLRQGWHDRAASTLVVRS
jgi:uncharacterized RDD family membrane protein YckC